ncbi:MAG: dihydrofolate reductase family protein [Actinobacteria bacterium]|jgi:riboflavin-specific deaminase-like protein|nr:dihydrofolate reductase family protein [Actinomycetota bacterium]
MASYHLEQIDQIDLSEFYPDPKLEPTNTVWIRANFATAANGVVKVDDQSQAVSGPPDRAIFNYLRKQCNAILVGAGTARKENYGVPQPNPDSHARPRLVIVSNSLDIPSNAKFLDREHPPLIVTSAKSYESNNDEIDGFGNLAEFVILGEEKVDLSRVKTLLSSMALTSVLCEGGPNLFSQLLSLKLINELCLTISPKIAGGKPTGIAELPQNLTIEMELGSHLSIDNFQFCRYIPRYE